jgi:hypothetical protein
MYHVGKIGSLVVKSHTLWQIGHVNGGWDSQSVLYELLLEPHNNVVAAALALGPPHLGAAVCLALYIL